MVRCSCSGRTCSCVLQAGDGVAITGAGTNASPYVIEAEGGAGDTGWDSGDLKLTAAFSTPAGWLECLGQPVSRATYADLFTAIGTTWGIGNGSTTFNLPNFADRFPMGAGNRPVGSGGGNENVSITTAHLPPHVHSIAHDHPVFSTIEGGGHRHKLDLSNEDGTNNARVRRGGEHTVDSVAPMETNGSHTHNVNVPPFDGSSGPGPGSGAALLILPPYRVVRYLIKT